MNLADIRSRLEGLEGRRYWRSLEELADTRFREYIHREFPSQASEFNDPAGRRQFLKLMGASLALAGVGACTRQPYERIVPYVRQPEEVVPGRPLFFATAMPIGGFGMPLLAENHLGRPTKLEGNPEHPASLGATDLFSQTSVLGLYDPDRSRTVTNLGDEDLERCGRPGARSMPRRKMWRRASPAHRPISSPSLPIRFRRLSAPGEVAPVIGLRHAPGGAGRPCHLRFQQGGRRPVARRGLSGFWRAPCGIRTFPPPAYRHARRRAQPAPRRRAGSDVTGAKADEARAEVA
jgi:MoCo/4Fe-4S cofactor protein with predicted Tat translocation signal